MAENPAQWGEATKIINEALEEYIRGAAKGYIGFSGSMQIADALHRAGFLTKDDIWVDDPGPATPEPPPFDGRRLTATTDPQGEDEIGRFK